MKTGEEAVGALLDILNRLSIEYMVVGSFSSNRYGVPRATKDADLVLKVVAQEREKLFRELPAGFEIDSQVTIQAGVRPHRRGRDRPEATLGELGETRQGLRRCSGRDGRSR